MFTVFLSVHIGKVYLIEFLNNFLLRWPGTLFENLLYVNYRLHVDAEVKCYPSIAKDKQQKRVIAIKVQNWRLDVNITD